jgi:hypothetical protein
MSTRNLPVGKGRPARKAYNLAAICEPIVQKIWEPRRLATLWTSTACYRDTFTFFFYCHLTIWLFTFSTRILCEFISPLPRPSHHLYFDHNRNIWWRVEIIEFSFMQFYPTFTASPSGTNVLLNTLSSGVLKLCSYFRVRHQFYVLKMLFFHLSHFSCCNLKHLMHFIHCPPLLSLE